MTGTIGALAVNEGIPVNGILGDFIIVEGETITGSADVADASITVLILMEGQIDASADLSGGLSPITKRLEGAIDASADADLTLSLEKFPAGQVALGSGNIANATLSKGVNLEGSLDVSGDLADGFLTTVILLAGVIDASADATGDVLIGKPLGGSVDASASVASAEISLSKFLEGEVIEVSASLADGNLQRLFREIFVEAVVFEAIISAVWTDEITISDVKLLTPSGDELVESLTVEVI